MRIRRLGWAGIEVESGGETVVVDHVLGWKSIESYIGPPRTPLLEPESAGRSLAAFVTHLHTDHTDAAAVSQTLAEGGSLHRPAVMEGEPLETGGVMAAELELKEAAVDQVLMDEWESVEVGPFVATAVPAVDGFGDPQISWVIEADGKRIIHAGDTLFHGSWWLIQMRFGPFDAAFLPVNGAITSFPHRQPASGLEASLSPEQAVAAARILGAKRLVPIHYDGIDEPPVYQQTDDIISRLQNTLDGEESPELVVMAEGETLDL
ncbi:MAG TPA: MBL fold metallo-hydrolase [Solirubrobacterales bacterium]|nr:MBL fold metallo-hydrolase [Solirubrobacterales bacterium]HMU26037.1 MBL fold metallo-hydrolase [Solirubrobacterales bacterium]HMY25482.1 MBL fold metallo-hydrolase [Solirubrobacterales bacterium]HNA44789.1 MBL fold metallo-hydrolase [Solirubrobacterales bacterium]HNF83395.1 MBL fold metallo-hydrolase [Solirubrobacterales bacterium]